MEQVEKHAKVITLTQVSTTHRHVGWATASKGSNGTFSFDPCKITNRQSQSPVRGKQYICVKESSQGP